jgi:hypothetical protein
MNGHTGRKPKKSKEKKTNRICKYKHTRSLTASGLQCSHKEPQRHRAHLGGPLSDQSPMSHTSQYPTPGTSTNHDSSSSLVLAAPPTLAVLVSGGGGTAPSVSRAWACNVRHRGATVVHIVWLLLFRDCIIFFYFPLYTVFRVSDYILSCYDFYK